MKWHFDQIQSNRYMGINDSAIEMFKDNVCESLTREIIQNSLDAQNDLTKPVKINFSIKKLNIREIPEVYDYMQTIANCINQAKLKNDEKAIKILTNMVDVLSSKSINCLLVSDYNTIGLSDVLSDNGTFQTLVNSQGYSQKKSDSSGGSFGIGKNACFSASDLRLVFYNTLNMQNQHGFQGSTILTSFYKEGEKNIYLPKGLFPKEPILNNKTFFKKHLKRSKVGTDILICGFNYSDYKKRIVMSCLTNFYFAIYSNKLEIIVDDLIIDKSSFKQIIIDYYLNLKKFKMAERKEIKLAFNCINALENKVDVKIDNYDASIFLTFDKNYDLTNEIVGIRSSGMVIHKFNRLVGSIRYNGVFYTEDRELNKILKYMENPQHDRWEASRHPNNKTQGELLIKKIRFQITEQIKAHLNVNEISEFNLNGLSELLSIKRSKKDNSNQTQAEVVNIDTQNKSKSNHKLMIDVFNFLNPDIETQSLMLSKNFKILNQKSCSRSCFSVDNKKFVLNFKTKIKRDLFFQCYIKREIDIINLSIKSISDDVILLTEIDDNCFVIKEAKGEYKIEIDSSYLMRCAVEVKIREIKI